MKMTKSELKALIKECINESLIKDTDNLDAEATMLELDNGDKVEVNPCQIFANMVANGDYNMRSANRELAKIINKYLMNEGASVKIQFIDVVADALN